jgi:hypothetical protein
MITHPPEYLLSARGTVFGALCAYGFFGFVGTTSALSASVSDFMVWDGGIPFSGLSRGRLHARGAVARPGTDFFYLIW